MQVVESPPSLTKEGLNIKVKSESFFVHAYSIGSFAYLSLDYTIKKSPVCTEKSVFPTKIFPMKNLENKQSSWPLSSHPPVPHHIPSNFKFSIYSSFLFVYTLSKLRFCPVILFICISHASRQALL